MKVNTKSQVEVEMCGCDIERGLAAGLKSYKETSEAIPDGMEAGVAGVAVGFIAACKLFHVPSELLMSSVYNVMKEYE